jgi:hypothetical protein
MAGHGPAPKDPEKRRNQNAKARGEWVTIPTPTAEPPLLPEGDWHEDTADAWSGWWSDPASTQWTAADLVSVHQLLILVDEFHRGRTTQANEIRLRGDGLGLTQKGKRDLRWRVGVPAEGDDVTPVPVAGDSRRERLRVVV